jgi:hypothetical protein
MQENKRSKKSCEISNTSWPDRFLFLREAHCNMQRFEVIAVSAFAKIGWFTPGAKLRDGRSVCQRLRALDFCMDVALACTAFWMFKQ